MMSNIDTLHKYQRIDFMSLPAISQVDNDELILQEFLLFDALLFFGLLSKINVGLRVLYLSPEITSISNNFRSLQHFIIITLLLSSYANTPINIKIVANKRKK